MIIQRYYTIEDTEELRMVLDVIRDLIPCYIIKAPDGMWNAKIAIEADIKDFEAIEGILSPLIKDF